MYNYPTPRIRQTQSFVFFMSWQYEIVLKVAAAVERGVRSFITRTLHIYYDTIINTAPQTQHWYEYYLT